MRGRFNGPHSFSGVKIGPDHQDIVRFPQRPRIGEGTRLPATQRPVERNRRCILAHHGQPGAIEPRPGNPLPRNLQKPRAQPLPPFPDEMAGDTLKLVVPVQFSLER